MKKIIAVLCAVSCILTASVCAFAEPADVPSDTVSVSDLPKIEKPLVVPGTTPPPEGELSLMADISEEAVDISTQIYKNIINCPPTLFLQTDDGIKNLSDWKAMSDDELTYVENLSDSILDECDTADEKIRAVAEYVAKNVYYDYDYANKGDREYADLNLTPYEVLTNKYTVCAGYAAASSALLLAADIPCVYVHSPDHAWNMAYDGKRWVLFDTTWMSGNKYENGKKQKGKMNTDWFDFTLEAANREENHLLIDADYSLYNGTLSRFPVYTSQESFTVPETVKHFGDYVFFECGDSLTLTIPGKPETVGYAAFYFCDALSGTVNLESTKTIDGFAFCGCFGLDNIVSFQSAETIGENAFYGCENMEGKAQFYQLKTVGDYAFYGCKALGGEWHLKNLVSVGKSAFYQCTNIGGVLHTVHLESAGEFAFY
ncbi:MAG: leucine-rich repeat protein, partial [Clostridia bacterium]|nr:leucine-rich repeat protein [Clostridia bacterium]